MRREGGRHAGGPGRGDPPPQGGLGGIHLLARHEKVEIVTGLGQGDGHGRVGGRL